MTKLRRAALLPAAAVTLLLLVALAALLPTTSLAQGMTPVGEVKDHPVSPGAQNKGSNGAAAAAAYNHRGGEGEGEAGEAPLNLDGMPRENMQSLFNWVGLYTLHPVETHSLKRLGSTLESEK
jgi:hypothetical protein